MARSRGSGIGDGDPCPVDPEHGNMFVLRGGRQYCSHVSHVAHGKERPATRSLWPTGYRSFEQAVKEYHSVTDRTANLPDLDIELEM